MTMQAQKEAPVEMQCKDKFLVQSVVTSSVTSVKDVTSDLVVLSPNSILIIDDKCDYLELFKRCDYLQFSKESGNRVEEFRLKVTYVSPPRPPSPVREESEEGTSPRHSLSENGSLSSSDKAAVSEFFGRFSLVKATGNVGLEILSGFQGNVVSLRKVYGGKLNP